MRANNGESSNVDDFGTVLHHAYRLCLCGHDTQILKLHGRKYEVLLIPVKIVLYLPYKIKI